eukprot:jgi/Mesvir1/19475/Mv10496-RA.1
MSFLADMSFARSHEQRVQVLADRLRHLYDARRTTEELVSPWEPSIQSRTMAMIEEILQQDRDSQLQRTLDALERKEKEVLELQAQLHAREQELADARRERDDKDAELARGAKRLASMQGTVQSLQEECERLAKKLSAVTVAKAEADTRVGDAQQAAAALEEQASRWSDAARAETSELRESEAGLRHQLDKLRHDLAAAEHALLERARDKEQQQRKIEELQLERLSQDLSVRSTALSSSKVLAAVQAELEEAKKGAASEREARAKLEQALQASKRQKQHLQEDVRELEALLHENERERDDLRAKYLAVGGKVELLLKQDAHKRRAEAVAAAAAAAMESKLQKELQQQQHQQQQLQQQQQQLEQKQQQSGVAGADAILKEKLRGLKERLKEEQRGRHKLEKALAKKGEELHMEGLRKMEELEARGVRISELEASLKEQAARFDVEAVLQKNTLTSLHEKNKAMEEELYKCMEHNIVMDKESEKLKAALRQQQLEYEGMMREAEHSWEKTLQAKDRVLQSLTEKLEEVESALNAVSPREGDHAEDTAAAKLVQLLDYKLRAILEQHAPPPHVAAASAAASAVAPTTAAATTGPPHDAGARPALSAEEKARQEERVSQLRAEFASEMRRAEGRAQERVAALEACWQSQCAQLQQACEERIANVEEASVQHITEYEGRKAAEQQSALVGLKYELASVERQLSERAEEVVALDAQLARAQASLEESRAENLLLADKLAYATSTRVELEGFANEADRHLSRLKKLLAAEQARVADALQAQAEAEATASHKAKLLAAVEAARGDAEASLERMSDTAARLMGELRTVTQRMEEMREEASERTNQLEAAREDAARAQQELSAAVRWGEEMEEAAAAEANEAKEYAGAAQRWKVLAEEAQGDAERLHARTTSLQEELDQANAKLAEREGDAAARVAAEAAIAKLQATMQAAVADAEARGRVAAARDLADTERRLEAALAQVAEVAERHRLAEAEERERHERAMEAAAAAHRTAQDKSAQDKAGAEMRLVEAETKARRELASKDRQVHEANDRAARAAQGEAAAARQVDKLAASLVRSHEEVSSLQLLLAAAESATEEVRGQLAEMRRKWEEACGEARAMALELQVVQRQTDILKQEAEAAHKELASARSRYLSLAVEAEEAAAERMAAVQASSRLDGMSSAAGMQAERERHRAETAQLRRQVEAATAGEGAARRELAVATHEVEATKRALAAMEQERVGVRQQFARAEEEWEAALRNVRQQYEADHRAQLASASALEEERRVAAAAAHEGAEQLARAEASLVAARAAAEQLRWEVAALQQQVAAGEREREEGWVAEAAAQDAQRQAAAEAGAAQAARDAATRAATELSEARAELEVTRGRLREAEARAREAKRALEALAERHRAALRVTAMSLRGKLAVHRAATRALRQGVATDIAKLQADAASKVRAVEAAACALVASAVAEASSAQGARHQVELARVTAKLDAAEGDREGLSRQLREALEECAVSAAELAGARGELVTLRDELAAVRDDLAAARDELAASAGELANTQQALAEQRAAGVALRAEGEAAARQLADLEALVQGFVGTVASQNEAVEQLQRRLGESSSEMAAWLERQAAAQATLAFSKTTLAAVVDVLSVVVMGDLAAPSGGPPPRLPPDLRAALLDASPDTLDMSIDRLSDILLRALKQKEGEAERARELAAALRSTEAQQEELLQHVEEMEQSMEQLSKEHSAALAQLADATAAKEAQDGNRQRVLEELMKELHSYESRLADLQLGYERDLQRTRGEASELVQKFMRRQQEQLLAIQSQWEEDFADTVFKHEEEVAIYQSELEKLHSKYQTMKKYLRDAALVQAGSSSAASSGNAQDQSGSSGNLSGNGQDHSRASDSPPRGSEMHFENVADLSRELYPGSRPARADDSDAATWSGGSRLYAQTGTRTSTQHAEDGDVSPLSVAEGEADLESTMDECLSTLDKSKFGTEF